MGLWRGSTITAHHEAGHVAGYLDLSDQETESLTRLLRHAIDDDRYPLSPRVQTWQTILDKLRPPPLREPLPEPKRYEPPRARARQRRR